MPPPRRTAFVPRLFLGGSLVAVVPACVIAAGSQGCDDTAADSQDVFRVDVSAHFREGSAYFDTGIDTDSADSSDEGGDAGEAGDADDAG
jgi:hypothetical protein